MKMFFINLILVIVVACTNVYAATFSVICNGKMEQASRSCTIKLAGVIKNNDADKLRKIIKSPAARGWIYGTLLLDSTGGDVSEALNIAKLVKKYMLKTSTYQFPDDMEAISTTSREKNFYSCISSCFLVWVAGTERFGPSGYSQREGGYYGIGLHRPFFVSEVYNHTAEKIAEMQQSMTSSVRDYLRREQVPDFYIDKMLEHSSKEIYWLSDNDVDFLLDGRAPWFEEMMIARCDFDPIYDRQSEARIVQRLMENTELAVRAHDSIAEQYIAWRQKYNNCEYKVKKAAQMQ